MTVRGVAPPADLEERRARARARIAPLVDLYPFEPRFLAHGEIAQHYLDEGPVDGSGGDEVLLLVHGNPTWSFYWRELVRSARESRRVVAPDHVGCGLSDKPQDYPYTLERHVENLVRLVDALELDRITLVVHDWGGAIGMGLARRRPDRIARLVVLNSAAFRSKRMPLRIALCRTPLFAPLAVRGLNVFARAATRMAVERPLDPRVAGAYLLPHDCWANRVATLAFVGDIPMTPRHRSHAELLAIEESLVDFRDRPALILWGERDWCFTPHFRSRWQDFLPGAEVRRFEHAGHWIMEDAGDEVVATIEGFLEANPL